MFLVLWEVYSRQVLRGLMAVRLQTMYSEPAELMDDLMAMAQISQQAN
jgi:hypothetical protein